MNMYVISGREECSLFLKGSVSTVKKAELTMEMFMYFYQIKIKNKFLNANA